MPIRFRCNYCNRLLGIATRKAGTETTCPHCGYTITVPVPTEDDAKTERVSMDDVDALLGNAVTERVAEPVAHALQQAAPPAPPRAAPPPIPKATPRADQEPMSLPPASSPPAKAPKAKPVPPPVPKAHSTAPTKPAHDPDDPPLFVGDVDAILGKSAVVEEEQRPKPPPTSGPDAMSLGDAPKMLVISAQKATLLMGAVVVLLGLAFAAGYFIAK